MSKDEEIRAIRVIPFSGKAEDFNMWKMKFLSRAKNRGFKDVLTGTTTIPKESEMLDENDPKDEPKIQARKMNEIAMEELLCSVSDPVSHGALKCSRTKDLPDGDSSKAWREMQSRFEPKTNQAKLELRHRFHACKMEDDEEDPNNYLTELENMRWRLDELGVKVDDEEFMTHIVHSLPPAYRITVMNAEKRIGALTNAITLQELMEDLRSMHARIVQDKKEMNAPKTEKIMYSGGRFKGYCCICGKQGHKAEQCWQNKNEKNLGNNGNQRGGRSTSNRFAGKCHYCDKVGHRENECRKKKRDQNGQNGQHDQANMMHTTDNVILMCAKQIDITDTNFWVCDSGASCHVTSSSKFMYDLKDVHQEIEVADGNKVECRQVGKLDLEYDDKQGKPIRITLTNVKFIPEINVIFSVS